MWLTQMIRTPPPPQTIHLKLGLFSIKSMIFSVAVGGFIGGPMPVFLACLRALGEGLFAPCYGFPHLNFTCSPICVERPPHPQIQLPLPIYFYFRIGNQITLLCFENFILFTKSVKMVLSAKDQLLLLSLLNVTTNFIIVGKVTCADEIYILNLLTSIESKLIYFYLFSNCLQKFN